MVEKTERKGGIGEKNPCEREKQNLNFLKSCRGKERSRINGEEGSIWQLKEKEKQKFQFVWKEARRRQLREKEKICESDITALNQKGEGKVYRKRLDRTGEEVPKTPECAHRPTSKRREKSSVLRKVTKLLVQKETLSEEPPSEPKRNLLSALNLK